MIKRLLISFALMASIALLLTACGGADNSNNAATDNKNSTSTTTPAATTSPASTTIASSGDKIGIAECDNYLAKYEACVSGKVPEQARAQYKTSLEQTRKSWREMANNPQTKPSLTAACKMASDQAKQTFGMFGCEF